MILRSFLAAVVTVASVPHAALAADPASYDRIEALCPGIGLSGLVFGQPEERQDQATLDALDQDLPVGRGEAEFTSWSGQLFAVEWRKMSPDGPTNQKWRMALEDRLAAQGWTPVILPGLQSLQTMDSAMAEKRVGDRILVIEYDIPGVQLLRCADRVLLELNAREMAGDLEPGSPRPLAPLAPKQPIRLPEQAVCQRSETIAAFSAAREPHEIGPMIERQFPIEDPAPAQSDYQRRLNTWLKWKLRTDGKLTEEQIWELEPELDDINKSIDSTSALLGALAKAAEAQREEDGRKLCLASIDILARMHADADREAAAKRKANALLEAEARRLGIAID